MSETLSAKSPEETFALGESLGRQLAGGSVVLLRGGLGAGKTLLTKGIVQALGFDVDEVTSPSFALVNLYKTDSHRIYHIDLWRIDEKTDAAFAVGLDELLEDPDGIVIIEWAERLGDHRLEANIIKIDIEGDGDEPRRIAITRMEQNGENAV